MSRFFTLKVRGIQNVYGIQRLIPQAIRRYHLYSFLRTFSTAVLALGFEWYTFSISYRAARSTPPAVSEIFDANKAPPTQLVIIMTVNANGSYPASVCAHKHRLQCGTAPQHPTRAPSPTVCGRNLWRCCDCRSILSCVQVRLLGTIGLLVMYSMGMKLAKLPS